MKDSIKREQNEFTRYAERENLRTKCKDIKYQQKLYPYFPQQHFEICPEMCNFAPKVGMKMHPSSVILFVL